MHLSEIEVRVHNLIKSHFLGVEEVENEHNVFDVYGVDSLDVVELVMAAEDEFEIEVADDETNNVKTVQDIVNIVVKYKGEK